MENYKVKIGALECYAKQIHYELRNMLFCVEEIQKKIDGLKAANLKEIDEETFFQRRRWRR